MPPKKVTLPDHVKDAVLDELVLDYQAWQDAGERFKIRLHLAGVQGVWQQDSADRLDVSTSVVSKWSRQGEQARERRRGVHPDGHGERQSIG